MNVDERRLRAKLAAIGLALRRIERIAVSGHAAVYRLVLTENRKAKLRIYPSTSAAALVHACLGASAPGLLPRPLALDGRRLIVEFVEGVALDRLLPNATARETGRWAAATGRLLARLHASPLPDVAFSPIDTYVRLREQTLRRLVQRRLIERRTAAALLEARPARSMPLAITHGDACPENLIVTQSGRLRAIDEERVAVRAVAYDLARAVWRWPLDSRQERMFLKAYRQAGGDPSPFEERRTFWLSSALTTSASHRLRYRPRSLAPVLRALRALAEGAG